MVNFAQAIGEQEARTENNMKARLSAANKCVDLFFKIGASRGKDIIPDFVAALVENEDKALRILQWVRDVRGGAGERQLFRDGLKYLLANDTGAALALLPKIPIIGRWDDVLVFLGSKLEGEAVQMLSDALNNNDGLAAKWMPRKGDVAVKLTKLFGLTPRQYRKLLVGLTNVVETKMCAREWGAINFSHVPSLAHSRYRKAFTKNAGEAYTKYVESLVKGEAKINAGAVYPYDVIKNLTGGNLEVVTAQWDALPNYMDDSQVLAMVDVSESMTAPVGGNPNLRCIDVAVSLGLYVADKLKGSFKDCMLTYSSEPDLMQLKGTILQKVQQLKRDKWYQSTDLHAAFNSILKTCLQNNVTPEDMPSMILILSDMQFNQCVNYDDSAIEMIERKYAEAGYSVPNVVFWNLNAHDNVPVRFDKRGTALISGFSPAIMKSVLAAKTITPEAIMDDTIMVERYAL